MDNLPPLLIKNDFTYECITKVTHTKFLGIIYDDKLKFEKHIQYLTSLLASRSALIYRLRDFLPKNILKKIYYSQVYSLLNYCNVVWANTFKSHLNPLILIHKRIIRNIAKAEFLAHTDELYKNLNILNINGINTLNLGTMMLHNVRKQNIQLVQGEHTYRTRNRNISRIPAHQTTLYGNSFLCQGIKLWNSLMKLITLPIKLTTFKLKLKRLLINGFKVV